MTLTKSDLKAIKDIVDESVEAAKRDTAAGFNEVHAKIHSLEVSMGQRINSIGSRLNSIENTAGRIEMQQRAMVTQLDDHAERLHTVEKPLGLARA